MVVDRSNVDHIMRGLQSTEGVRLHNHRKKLRQRFDIIRKLGQGTYGKVQLGMNKETGQEVAIKTIKKCKIETDADLVRIRREIQIMSSVRHPNIIHIYEVFENREKIVLVMEYAAGGELYDFLSEKKVLEETEARRIFRQISTAIYYCHKHKICHRDLKLENILLDEHGSAKIADFGLSNVFDDQRLLSTYCGSPLYASPEIVKGTPYRGPEVDCWSLGVLLYTLVYGAMPFDGSNFKRLVKQISLGDYFEPKKASTASPLIRELLTVNSPDRATIEQICSHWWVNQGFNVSCLDIAEDLANQTPVRLDLLLSLAPPPENSENIVVTDDQRAVPQECPPRSMSVGSFMELDAEERVRSFVAREVPSDQMSNEKTMKRKLEPVPSKSFSGARKKEKMKPDEAEEKEELVPVVTEESAKKIESNNIVMDVDAETNKTDEPIKSQEMSPEGEERENFEKAMEKWDEKITEAGRKESEKISAEETGKDEKKTRKSVKTVRKKVTAEKKNSEAEVKETEPMHDKGQVKKKKTEYPPVRGEGEDEKVKEDVREEVKKSEEEKPKGKEIGEKVKGEETAEQNGEQEGKEVTISQQREEPATKPVERRKSKIFETAEKFMTNEQKTPMHQEKPKKVFIPGVKVSDFAKAFERRTSVPASLPLKSPTSKKIGSKESSPAEKKSPEEVNKYDSPKVKKEKVDSIRTNDKTGRGEIPSNESPVGAEKVKSDVGSSEERMTQIGDDKLKKLKDSARNFISSALVEEEKKKLLKQGLKPPLSRSKTVDSDHEKKDLTLRIGKETATVKVHTPEHTKYFFDPGSENKENLQEKPKEKKTAKLEITLKSNTLPRRTSKAEVRLASPLAKNEAGNFRTEVEHRVGDPSHVYSTQRSEVAFPVSAATRPVRSMSLDPEGGGQQKQASRERIIPIQFEGGGNREEAGDKVKESDESCEGRGKHPYQRTWSLRSNSLSRRSTNQDAETHRPTGGREPIKKSPREFIIPIAVEGGGYVTPRATSLEPATESTKAASSARTQRPFSRKLGLWPDNGSEDEGPFGTVQRPASRDFDEPFRLHRLRSSRPAVERADSGSGSEEEEDDDGFELLTAENLFSTLLSRVRSLTQRLNVEDGIRPGFSSSRLLTNHFGPSERLFSNFRQPVMTRLSARSPDFGRSLNREIENGSNLWNRRDPARTNPESNRSIPKGNSNSNLSEIDGEDLSESGKSFGRQEKYVNNADGGRKKSRTKSVPPGGSECAVRSEMNSPALERNDGSTSSRNPNLSSRERESSYSSASKCRTETPKLMRPISLFLERRPMAQEAAEEPREKDFYDILAEKYGITKVKRYDLPLDRRYWREYRSEIPRSAMREKGEERERPEPEADEWESRKSKSKKEEYAAEKYSIPSEKLAAVLNRLERGQKNREDRPESGRNRGQCVDGKKKNVDREAVDEECGNLKGTSSDVGSKGSEVERRWEGRDWDEGSPGKSLSSKYLRCYSLEEETRKVSAREMEKKSRTATEKKCYIDKAIRSLRESSLGPTDVSSENVLIKRAVSLSDCPSWKNSLRGLCRRRPISSVAGMLNRFEGSGREKSKCETEKEDKCGEDGTKPETVSPKISGETFTRRRPSFSPKPATGDPADFASPDRESHDSWSVSSDSGFPDQVLTRIQSRLDNSNGEDSVSDRIRRKSFYTRFNEKRKQRRRCSLFAGIRDLDPDTESTSFRALPGKPTYYRRSVSAGDEVRPTIVDDVSFASARRECIDRRGNCGRFAVTGSRPPSSFTSFSGLSRHPAAGGENSSCGAVRVRSPTRPPASNGERSPEPAGRVESLAEMADEHRRTHEPANGDSDMDQASFAASHP